MKAALLTRSILGGIWASGRRPISILAVQATSVPRPSGRVALRRLQGALRVQVLEADQCGIGSCEVDLLRVAVRCSTEWLVPGDVVAVAVGRDRSRLAPPRLGGIRLGRFSAGWGTASPVSPGELYQDRIGALSDQFSSLWGASSMGRRLGSRPAVNRGARRVRPAPVGRVVARARRW